jgi:glutamate racemase
MSDSLALPFSTSGGAPAKSPIIGVFDSGFGGLTVLKALLEVLPEAKYLYFGDTARLPYGSKSVETVARYACEAARFLEREGAELLVIACNTATALALNQIREAASVGVVGVIEPGAQHAAAVSKSRKVVVIGTEATVCSHAYQNALAAIDIESREKACPLLVPLVEEGWIDTAVTEQVARIYLDEAFADGFGSADVLLLGCTHYPLLKPLLHRVALPNVALVDSAESTALAVHKLLESGSSAKTGGRARPPLHDSAGHAPAERPPPIRFFVTDSTEKFRRLGARFLGRPINEIRHVDLKE